MRYFIYSNSDELSLSIVKKIRYFISCNGNGNFLYDEKNPNLVISVGGDGRFLKTIQKYILSIQDIAIVGISTGTLGYLCDYDESSVDEFLYDLINVTPQYESRKLIEVYTEKNINFYLNEFRIEKLFNLFSCDVYINDELFENFKGNGLNFSSSTGSTAYNKSLNGPIVSSKNNNLIMGEIASLNNSISHTLNSFLVLNDKDVVTLKGEFNNCSIGGDCFNEIIDNKTNKIIIKLSKIKVTFAHFKKINIYQKIKKCFIERGN